jgi:hypothetical protein
MAYFFCLLHPLSPCNNVSFSLSSTLAYPELLLQALRPVPYEIDRVGINRTFVVPTHRVVSRLFSWWWVLSFEKKEDRVGGLALYFSSLCGRWVLGGRSEWKSYHILRLMECRNIDSSETQEQQKRRPAGPAELCKSNERKQKVRVNL